MDELEQLAETPDSEAAAAAAAQEHEQQADNHDSQDDAASQEQAEEDEEIEIGDKKFALPKSAAERLKSERMMQADYTRKTQEVAEDRKAAAAEREQVRQQAEQSQQYIKELSKVHALDEQLADFNALTPAQWEALADEDPVQAQKLQLRYQALQQQRNQAVEAVSRKQHENALNEQRTLATQVQEADAYFKREIPGWSQERSSRLQQFAIEQGLPADKLALAVIQNPALAKVLHQAELYNQLEKKQSAKPAKPAAPPAPVTRVGASRASAAKDPSRMSDAEWMRQRQEQQRKR